MITDLDMPLINGFLLASRIKKDFRETKTIIMTGRCHAEVFGMIAASVADVWLFKPFGIEELCRVLNDLFLIESRDRTREQMDGI